MSLISPTSPWKMRIIGTQCKGFLSLSDCPWGVITGCLHTLIYGKYIQSWSKSIQSCLLGVYFCWYQESQTHGIKVKSASVLVQPCWAYILQISISRHYSNFLSNALNPCKLISDNIFSSNPRHQIIIFFNISGLK